jgi:Bacterial surface protein, Ig-like domain/HYR domain
VSETRNGAGSAASPLVITRTFTATDSVGNAASATQTITVIDNTPPTLTLNGANPLTVECHTTFIDPGATASDNCAGNVPVTASGTVDANTPGTYTITYNATDSAGNAATAVTRTVNVVDTLAPTVTLVGANPLTVECHTSFTDPGATANDACAGDLTSALTVTGSVNPNAVGAYTLTYTVNDGHGHTATATRTVNVVDTLAPTLTLNGANPLTVECHTTFTDPGATASDACAGNLTGAIVVTGSVNANTVGVYTLTYTVNDGQGHTTTATRTVQVVDTTPPTISCPANVVVDLPSNSTATSLIVNYPAVTATDSCAGSATVTSTPAAGSVFPVGTTTVNATATDAAGNASHCSFTVTVRYRFTGFFAPVNNLPTVNVVNAGRAIPVKFSLSGNKGLNIFAPDSPASGAIACNASDPAVDLVNTVTAGDSSLSYDAGSDQYNYVWKTESAWAGTCRQLVLQLNDGSIYRANFRFR